MIMCSDNDELINAFLERLITNDVNSGNISQTEVLCNSYKKLLFKSMSDFKAMPVLNWNCIVFCLYHLNQFKKIFTILVENSSTINKFCFEILSLSDIFENIFELSKSSEVMLKCSAQDLIAYLVVCLFKHSHSSCQAYLDLVLDLIAKNAHTNLSCSIDILTSLIIEFKEIDMPGKVTDFLKHFCSNNLLSLNFSANIKVFYSSLYLVKELVNCVSVLNLTDVVLSVISLWLEKVHLKVIDSSYRLIFIKIIHTVLKSSSNTDTKVYFKTAHTFLYVFASNIAEIQADESCFGFGGRLNHSVDKTENAMFGKAEKMIFINTALDAFFICNVDGRESIEEKLQLTETFLFTKDGSFQVCDFFNLFLEQDDSMIEFLLLHLTLNIDLESKKKKMFLASPHFLFVSLLQNLGFDSSVLLDWLTSNETQFLLYFLKYLKYTTRTYDNFCAVCYSVPDINSKLATFNVFEKLRQSIEKLRSKNLFPYNVSPLLKVMLSVMHLLDETSG